MTRLKLAVLAALLAASGCSTLQRARLLEWGADIIDPGGAEIEAAEGAE